MTVQTAQKFIESYTISTSSTICIQDGKDAGQTVSHVHVHVSAVGKTVPKISENCGIF